jgi:catechol 2,3-dioxygenase-like lactoylglutathione lyase family enzyme
LPEAVTVDGIHHLKFPVADVERSRQFYSAVFGGRRIERADHRDADGNVYAYILEMPGWGTLLDLRLSPEHAAGAARLDPVTLNILDRPALAAWITHLDSLGVPNSGEIITALAFMLVIQDPDGRRIRLYTQEKHGPELAGAKDHPWMRL